MSSTNWSAGTEVPGEESVLAIHLLPRDGCHITDGGSREVEPLNPCASDVPPPGGSCPGCKARTSACENEETMTCGLSSEA